MKQLVVLNDRLPLAARTKMLPVEFAAIAMAIKLNPFQSRLNSSDHRRLTAIEAAKPLGVSGLLSAGIRFRHSNCANLCQPTVAKPTATDHQSAVKMPFWA